LSVRPKLDIASVSPNHTARVGAALGSLLRAGDVVALHGDLGAGKTNLVRGMAAGMGLDERQVSSPTFVIVSEYTTAAPGAARPPHAPLIHADAYRLSGPEDLDSVGWERVMDGSAVVAIEWAERITQGASGALGDEAFIGHVRLTPTGEQSRRIDLEVPAAWALRQEWPRVLAAAKAEEIRCPICRKPVAAESATWPFCSEQCRMADLGRWFAGQYSVSREIREDDRSGQ
jgi:tRNA threonylcarbamoyladenosine biosynthesis protein TsaE